MVKILGEPWLPPFKGSLDDPHPLVYDCERFLKRHSPARETRLVHTQRKPRLLISELIVSCGLFADVSSSPVSPLLRVFRGKGLNPGTLTWSWLWTESLTPPAVLDPRSLPWACLPGLGHPGDTGTFF